MLSEYLLLFGGAACLGIGAALGYFARQSIARLQEGSIEETLKKKLNDAHREAQNITIEAKKKAVETLGSVKKGLGEKENKVYELQRRLERKQGVFDQKMIDIKRKEKEIEKGKEGIKELKKRIEESLKKKNEELEKIGGISKEEAKNEIFSEVEKEYSKDLQGKIIKLEKTGEERFDKKAKEILSTVIQRIAVPSLSELTTISVPLPDDEIKGRIIGKEGRNIKAFESSTGVELLVDETPGVVFLSSFDSLRREVARVALDELIKDSRIQPAKIEEIVERVEKEMPKRMEKIGEQAAFEAEVFGLNSNLHQLLGRLKFRTSFGQNVLQHSLETAFLSSTLAEEIGADFKIAKKAGLLHDIGKAVDSQIEGSHVEIGIKILEKFKIEKEVINAMKSHHEDYPYETIESIIIQTADAVSSSRPGARKDTTENYLKRLDDLERIATSFPEVDKAYAIEAGREVRVFVRNEEIDDFGARKLAREIAKDIEEEAQYPGEIKINVIRETRAIEYAR